MENQINDKESKNDNDDRSSLYKFIAAIFVLVILMIVSIYYPYPNGKSLGFWNFVIIWFRELIILGVFLILLFAGIIKLILGRNKSDEAEIRSNKSLQSDAPEARR